MGSLMGEEERAAPEDAVELDMLAPLAAPEIEPPETPEAFLASVCKALRASNNVDEDLAGLVSDHLLTVTPHGNAVCNAKVAIVELAAKRAAAAEEKPDG